LDLFPSLAFIRVACMEVYPFKEQERVFGDLLGQGERSFLLSWNTFSPTIGSQERIRQRQRTS